jgi:hypothetical protein
MCPGWEGRVSGEAEPSGEVLYVEAKYDGTAAAIILVGEFDMTGTELFWGAFSEVLGTPRSPSLSRPAN